MKFFIIVFIFAFQFQIGHAETGMRKISSEHVELLSDIRDGAQWFLKNYGDQITNNKKQDIIMYFESSFEIKQTKSKLLFTREKLRNIYESVLNTPKNRKKVIEQTQKNILQFLQNYSDQITVSEERKIKHTLNMIVNMETSNVSNAAILQSVEEVKKIVRRVKNSSIKD